MGFITSIFLLFFFFACGISAQSYSSPSSFTNGQTGFTAQPIPPSQSSQSSQNQFVGFRWPYVYGGNGAQIPSGVESQSIRPLNTNRYSPEMYQMLINSQLPVSQESSAIYGPQSTIPSSSTLPSSSSSSSALHFPSAFFSGSLSADQIQQLALQAAQPTLTQWSTDSAESIFARSVPNGNGNGNAGALNTNNQIQQGGNQLNPMNFPDLSFRNVPFQQQTANPIPMMNLPNPFANFPSVQPVEGNPQSQSESALQTPATAAGPSGSLPVRTSGAYVVLPTNGQLIPNNQMRNPSPTPTSSGNRN